MFRTLILMDCICYDIVTLVGEHPAVLKDSVCSPGGTTIAGVHALELVSRTQAYLCMRIMSEY